MQESTITHQNAAIRFYLIRNKEWGERFEPDDNNNHNRAAHGTRGEREKYMSHDFSKYSNSNKVGKGEVWASK
jgi:hypothetical protein